MTSVRIPYRLALPCLLLITACTLQEQNGDLRIQPAPLFAHQQWDVTQQAVASNHDRVCTVSAGGIDITQREHDGSLKVQVETRNPMEPGSGYAIIVGDHRYESVGDRFDETQSQQIVDDFSRADTTYTEWREFDGGEGSRWHWFSNKIPLAGFTHEYQDCTRYVMAAHKQSKY